MRTYLNHATTLIKSASPEKGGLVYGFFIALESLFFNQFKIFFCQEASIRIFQFYEKKLSFHLPPMLMKCFLVL